MPSGSLISFPAFPAPASIEPAYNDTVGQSTSTFDPRLQQFYNWGTAPMEISIMMPPINQSSFGPWITFLEALQGQANYFTLESAFVAQYPELSGRYWRLKSNRRNWMVPKDRYYRLILDCREAF